MTAIEPVLHTDLPGALSRRQGKVRDIYDFGDRLLIVVTDRISAFDVVMNQGIPGKGKVLNALSKFWFAKTSHIVPNHVLSTDVADFPAAVQPYAEILEGRSMLVLKTDVAPIECVVRGYLAGSGWKSYLQNGTVCGRAIEVGLQESSKLPHSIFTPSTKAEEGHDVNISFDEMVRITGKVLGRHLREKSLALYDFATEYLQPRRLIIADTKFEFGLKDGELIVIDEMMTPDSSRYWDVDKYEPGRGQESLDKQPLRDWLETLGWDKTPPGPVLPPEVVEATAQRYEEALRRVTG